MVDITCGKSTLDSFREKEKRRLYSHLCKAGRFAFILCCVLKSSWTVAEQKIPFAPAQQFVLQNTSYDSSSIILVVIAITAVLSSLSYYLIITKEKLDKMLDRTQQMTHQLKRSTEQLSYMVATSPTVLFALKVERDHLIPHWISDNLTRITGYSIEEALNPSWWEQHLYEQDRSRVLKESKALFSGKHLAYEYRFVHKKGSIIWIRDEQQLVIDENGLPKEVLAAWTEITDRKLEEIDLRIAATAFEVNEGILITDKKGRIIRINSAFTRLTGYSMEEAVGKYPDILQSGIHDKEFYEKLWDELKLNRHWEGEVWDRHKNGSIYPVWLSISAVTDNTGEISHYVSAFFDVSALKEAEEHIRNLAFYDPLTHLPNRRLMLDRLGIALVSSQRNQHHGALMMMDLDRFKILNDTQGHDLGDKLLIEVAKRLQSCVREGDTVARMGGDEFVVMLENLSKMEEEAAVQTLAVAEKILEALAATYWLELGNQADNKTHFEHHSSASIGLVLFLGHAVPINDLLKRADMAMYQAKHAGRDTIRVFDPAMQSVFNERNALEADLRHALGGNELDLLFQVQVDAAGQAVGAEVLLHWRHPQRGFVPPLKFIPLAEETGLILPIGHWVLCRACAILAGWASHPLTRNLTLSVNISARQFRQPDFIDQVRLALEKFGADPALLKLEINESMVMENPEAMIAKMFEIKKLGVEFAMDDFGTGYSSLAYLSLLPVKELKIDREFIRDFSKNSQDAAIIRSILSLGRSLDLVVIAEGVETKDQWRYLSKYRCPFFQGYFFGRPIPLADFEAYLAKKELESY
ncbi:MAG: bifunctional diguanylate cyclase/phosphodiesterase [Methylosarcina sp.]